MRINKFVALATGMSRRAADKAIVEQRVKINGRLAKLGDQVTDNDEVSLDGSKLSAPSSKLLVMLNKPAGYVCSRDGQGSKTIYDLLPRDLHYLKPIGRLDKDSSGLLLLTDDGKLAHELTHPSFNKEKVYEIELDRPLSDVDKAKIDQGIVLDDGLSKLSISPSSKLQAQSSSCTVHMSEGRNRQIRRTFNALGYKVTKLHRIQFGSYKLGRFSLGEYSKLSII